MRHGNVDAFCERLSEKYETAIVPGRFFEMPQHVRIGICCEPENFTAGLERLGTALDHRVMAWQRKHWWLRAASVIRGSLA